MIRNRVIIPGVDDSATSPEEEPRPRDHNPTNTTALREAERVWKSSKRHSEAVPFTDFIRQGPFEVPFSYENVTYSLVSERCLIPGKEDGIVYLPQVLPPELQLRLAEHILTEHLRPENESNLHALYEGIPAEGLFACSPDHAVFRKTLERVTASYHDDDGKAQPETATLRAGELLERLRWVNIGLRYDWTTKEYDLSVQTPSVHPLFASLARALAAAVSDSLCSYRPEAGIVNVYKPTDSLTCHVDRSERNVHAPLVSISLGLPAVFLVGGRTREDAVESLLLRSGDVIIMHGPGRQFFHGVPKVFSAPLPLFEGENDHVGKFLTTHRINVNLRQVF